MDVQLSHLLTSVSPQCDASPVKCRISSCRECIKLRKMQPFCLLHFLPFLLCRSSAANLNQGQKLCLFIAEFSDQNKCLSTYSECFEGSGRVERVDCKYWFIEAEIMTLGQATSSSWHGERRFIRVAARPCEDDPHHRGPGSGWLAMLTESLQAGLS